MRTRGSDSGLRRLVGACVLAVMIVASPAGAGHAQEPVSIEYWHINSATFGAQAVKQSVAAFEAKHRGVRVVERFQEGSYGGLLNKLQAALAAKKPPAVTQMGYNFRLFALEELPHKAVADFSRSDSGYGSWIEGFDQSVLRLGQDRHGYQRAIPYAISVPILYYNGDLFRRAGLDPDKPPATWEQVRQYAKQIRERTQLFGLGIQISDSNNWVPQSLIESNGGHILDAKGAVAVDRPEVVEVYRFWQTLALTDKSVPVVTDNEQQQAFLGGQLGMYIRTSASLGNFSKQSKFDLRTAPFPTWGGKPRRVAAGGNALFIFGADAREQQAAYELVKFLTSKEGQTIWVKETGYLPVVRGLEQDPAALKDYFEKTPLARAVLVQTSDIVPWLAIPGPRGFEAEQALIAARQAILTGADVERSLKEAASRMTQLLAR